MILNKFSILLMCYSLSACSTMAVSNNQYSTSDYMELISADEELHLHLNPKRDFNKQKNIQSIAEEKCLHPYMAALDKILRESNIQIQPTQKDKLIEAKRILKKAENKSLEMDRKIPSCLKPLEVGGVVRFNYRGHYYSTQEYLQMVMVRTDQLVSLNNRRDVSSNIAAEFLGNFADNMLMAMTHFGSNKNEYYVNSYTRRDGTRVSGHYRTAPNGYCSDNINGCK